MVKDMTMSYAERTTVRTAMGPEERSPYVIDRPQHNSQWLPTGGGGGTPHLFVFANRHSIISLDFIILDIGLEVGESV